jgi:hypothetical protein
MVPVSAHATATSSPRLYLRMQLQRQHALAGVGSAEVAEDERVELEITACMPRRDGVHDCGPGLDLRAVDSTTCMGLQSGYFEMQLTFGRASTRACMEAQSAGVIWTMLPQLASEQLLTETFTSVRRWP